MKETIMSMKYELINNDTFTKIRALRDIPRHNVKAGDIGGRVQTPYNLSQEGDCWIEQGSMVRHEAHVSGNALICNTSAVADRSIVSGDAIIDDSGIYEYAVISDNVVITDCVAFDNPVIRGNTRIENLRLMGACDLYGDTEIVNNKEQRCTVENLQGEFSTDTPLIQGPALSSGRYSFAYQQTDGSVKVTCGCFEGSLDEYLAAIEETHKNNHEYLKQYREFHANFVSYFSS